MSLKLTQPLAPAVILLPLMVPESILLWTAPNSLNQVKHTPWKFNNNFIDNIMTYIMPPLAALKTSYESAFQDYLDSQKRIEIIKFVLFILFCFFAFFFLWQPYLKNLKDKIFRTKGMLNMIPMDIISKNEGLRVQFLGDNIMRAVK